MIDEGTKKWTLSPLKGWLLCYELSSNNFNQTDLEMDEVVWTVMCLVFALLEWRLVKEYMIVLELTYYWIWTDKIVWRVPASPIPVKE